MSVIECTTRVASRVSSLHSCETSVVASFFPLSTCAARRTYHLIQFFDPASSIRNLSCSADRSGAVLCICVVDNAPMRRVADHGHHAEQGHASIRIFVCAPQGVDTSSSICFLVDRLSIGNPFYSTDQRDAVLCISSADCTPIAQVADHGPTGHTWIRIFLRTPQGVDTLSSIGSR